MSPDVEPTTQMTDRTNHLYWSGPLLFMVAVSLYFLARSGGHWAETDSATFTSIIRSFTADTRLIPRDGEIYTNGFAYQAISAYIMSLTGVEVATLQQLIYPLLTSLVVLPAWLLYRELIGSARGAAIATMLLLTQPDFLFVIIRSSHEKFTRALMLICLYLLVRSFRLGDHPRWFAAHVAMFYIVMTALIASNNLIAHSFIFAMMIAVAAGQLIQNRSRALMQQHRLIFARLQYVLLTCIAYVYVFTFYVYPPALHELSVLRSVWDQVAALFLNSEDASATNAYEVVSTGWLNVPVFILVSSANWLILIMSLGIWIRQGYRWLWRGELPRNQTAFLVWLLYAAFALQGVLAVIADLSGALASNMQQRLFPSYSIFAVAIVAGAIAQWQPRRIALPARIALTAGICVISILSVFKGTNEPLVSNGWMFYRPSEMSAMVWSDTHLENSRIWTDFNERLAVAFGTDRGDSQRGNAMTGGVGTSLTTRDIVLTDVTRLRSSRLHTPLPILPDALRVYDNGQAQVYHLRPETPFQP